MKIRIKGNSLRLRLSQTEIQEMQTEGVVSDSIDFGGNKLIYMLQITEQGDINASFEGNYITVGIPASMADQWLNSDRVGLENQQLLNTENSLYILIEKDFQCLKERPGEDETDLFKNPLAQ